jgi:CheY-like chemotaxis protein/HPt (histidine-containing phosphotransfer) domain-containing protein
MTSIRLLHIEDEPDIREVVELALALDPIFKTRSCESGAEGLTVAAEWQPDIILLDVMMPALDGPATLAQLRANPQTAAIPVVFMTARAQSRETDRFRALGAVGVIAKPFDPMTLAASVRRFIQPPPSDPLAELRGAFLLRVERDATRLEQNRLALQQDLRPRAALDQIKRTAHSLAGAGGIYGFAALSDAAAALEDATLAEFTDAAAAEQTDRALDHLLRETKRCRPPTSPVERMLQET